MAVKFLKIDRLCQIESLTSFLCTLVRRHKECSGFELWSATFHDFFEFEKSKQEKTEAWRKYYFDFKKFQKKYKTIIFPKTFCFFKFLFRPGYFLLFWKYTQLKKLDRLRRADRTTFHLLNKGARSTKVHKEGGKTL